MEKNITLHSPSDILLPTAEAAAESYERLLCTYRAYAMVLADEFLSLYDTIGSAYETLLLLSSSVHLPRTEYNSASVRPDIISRAEQGISVFGTAVLPMLLIERLSELGFDLSLDLLVMSAENENSITYMKNALSDEAYDVFSAEREGLRISYCDSLRAGVAKVSSGEAGMLILPIEEHGGARIGSIMDTVRESNLKIIAITPVFGFGGDADTKYALLGTEVLIPTLSEDDDLYAELEFGQNDMSIATLCSLAEYIGLSVYRINGGSEGYSVIFSANEGALCSLLTALMLFGIGYNIRGIYKNLE